jgi:hypothetical protein
MLAKQILLVSVLAGLILSVGGCRTSVVGINSAAYYSGKLHAVTDKDITAVYNATLKALSDLEISVTYKDKDVFSARVKAQTADGKTTNIIIKPRTDDLTDFSIKVGAFGNEHRSNLIYEKIQQNLGIAGK